jgi:hypothetical protein
MPKDRFCTILQQHIADQDAVLAQFHKNLQEQPVPTLIWADNTFQAAASRQVFTWVLTALTKSDTKVTLHTILHYAQGQTLICFNRNPSTSVCENLMNVCMGRAWTRLLGHLVDVGVLLNPLIGVGVPATTES